MAITKRDFLNARVGGWFSVCRGGIWRIQRRYPCPLPLGLLVSLDGQDPRWIYWHKGMVFGHDGIPIAELNDPKCQAFMVNLMVEFGKKECEMKE